VKGSDGVAATTEKPERVGLADVRPAPTRTSLLRVVAGLLPFALAFAVYLFVFLDVKPGATGDEPHYLITAESIAFDGDVDLRNDYASAERVLRMVNVFPLGPDARVYKDSGELRPIRGVGLPAVLAPGVALGGLTGGRIVMVLIAALMADQLYRLLRDLRLRRRYRMAAWAAAVFCLPVILFSSQIYPELAGALLVVIALRVMVSGASSPVTLALGASAGAALAWFHVRYVPLAAGIFLGLLLAACVDGWSPPRRGRGLRDTPVAARALIVRCANVLVKRWRTTTLPVVAPYALGFGLLALAFQHWYGSPDLHAPYEAYGDPAVGTGHWNFWYHYALRDILDPVVGWIPFAPVHWLGFAGLGCLVVMYGWPAAGAVAVAAGYELLISSVGTGVGFGLPARYPMIVVPLIAVPLAVVIQRIRVARLMFVPLLAVSLVFVVAAARNFARLYPGDVQRIVGLRSTAPAFPELAGVQAPVSFTLPANGSPAPQTGKVQGDVVVAKAGRDRPGFVRFGPWVGLKAGAYTATFSLAADGARPSKPAATVQIFGAGETGVASQEFTGRELRSPSGLKNIDLNFATPGGRFVETRVYYHGNGTLRTGAINVQPIAVPQPVTHYRDWPLVFLWVCGTVLVGWLFVQVMMLSRQRVDA
jgi:hypothetical protein